jgi:thiamine pyrophosphokinase
VENSLRVLGVLSGGDNDRELLRRWAQSADRVIAAEAGADLLLDIEVVPHLIIGVMDSISPRGLSSAAKQLLVEDQDTTDCDKLLAQVALEGHSSVTLIGVEGDLPDHVLASLHSAARSNLDVRLAYRRGIGWIVKPHRPRRITTKPGRRLSLLGLEPCEGVHLLGCQWPLENARLGLQDSTSISNRTEADEVTVTIDKGAALLFIEYPIEEMPVW